MSDVKKKYGFPFLDNMSQFAIELFGYSNQVGTWGAKQRMLLEKVHGLKWNDFNFLPPEDHLYNAIKIAWPNDFYIEFGKYRNRFAMRIIDKLCYENDISIAGSASSGKTFTVAAWSILDWMAAPNCTLTMMATTTLGAAEDRLYGAMTSLYRSGKDTVGWHKNGFSTLVDYKRMIVFGGFDQNRDERMYKNAIKLIAIERGEEGKKAIETTRGRKNDRIRFVFDELPEMGMYCLDVRVNLSANEDTLYVGMGNPLPGENPHSAMSEPIGGWETVNKDVEEWKTKTGVCIFLNGEKSPNFDAPPDEPPPFPYLLTRQKLDRILMYCNGNANSLEYYRNAVGFWNFDNVECTVVSKGMIISAKIGDEPHWGVGKKKKLAALDPSFSYGGDKAVAAFGTLGVTDEGKQVLYLDEVKEYLVESDSVFEECLARHFVEDCIRHGVDPSRAGLDISGDGGKTLSAIVRHWSEKHPTAHSIVTISSVGAPTDRTVSSSDFRKCKDAYDRLVTEYWFSVNHAISNRCIFGLDVNGDKAIKDAISQLCSRYYTIKGRKVSIEPKGDMKARIGRSPDNADAVVYLIEMARRNGLMFVSDSSFKRTLVKKNTSQRVEIATYTSDDWGE